MIIDFAEFFIDLIFSLTAFVVLWIIRRLRILKSIHDLDESEVNLETQFGLCSNMYLKI